MKIEISKRLILANVLLAFVILFSAKDVAAITDAYWEQINPAGIASTNGTINAAVCGKDVIYVGGKFTVAGNDSARNVAMWNGHTWSRLGAGINGIVLCMCLSPDGNLYVGGEFDTAGVDKAGNIAWWDGVEWHKMETSPNGSVRYITSNKQGKLYISGSFGYIGNLRTLGLASWDGTSWDTVPKGDGGSAPMVCDDSGNVYKGGFSGTYALRNNYWSLVSYDLSSQTDDLIFGNDGYLYVASYNSVSVWDGNEARILTKVNGGTVRALTFTPDGTLYYGGKFDSVDTSSCMNIAQWKDGAWSSMGSGLNDSVRILVSDSSGSVYAIGDFTRAGEVGVNGIACWKGNQWHSLGDGITGTIYAVAYDSNGDIYIGGNFNSVGGIAANNIAKWDGNEWAALGLGVDSLYSSNRAGRCVTSIICDGKGHVYVGGGFQRAGGLPIKYIARWNGTNWDSLGRGISEVPANRNGVNVLTMDVSGRLYVGGEFIAVDTQITNSIAVWDNNTWQPLGSDSLGLMGAKVNSMAFDSRGNLYVGGFFQRMGYCPAKNIAIWNGVQWDSVGSGTNDEVTSLTTDDIGNVYAAGFFNVIDSFRVQNVARYDGIRWESLGKGIGHPGGVYAMICDRAGNLYAGGLFESANGTIVNNLAKWDGLSWTRIGSGTTGEVNSLALIGSMLYVGGSFTVAGGKFSPGIARVNVASANAINPFTEKNNLEKPVRYRLKGATLFADNITEKDQVEIYSLSGRLVYKTAGKSVIKLPALVSQTIIISIKREGRRVMSNRLLVTGR